MTDTTMYMYQYLLIKETRGKENKETDTTPIMLQSLKKETEDMIEQKTKVHVKKTITIRIPTFCPPTHTLM